jgi:SPP1 family predicted phage head-tail adaptor
MVPRIPEAGEMRERLTLQSRTAGTADAGGGAPQTWTTIKTVWARVQPLSVNQRMNAMSLQLRTTHRVIMRYEAELVLLDNDVYRLLWASNSNQLLHVTGTINPDEHRRFVEVMVEIGQSIKS